MAAGSSSTATTRPICPTLWTSSAPSPDARRAALRIVVRVEYAHGAGSASGRESARKLATSPGSGPPAPAWCLPSRRLLVTAAANTGAEGYSPPDGSFAEPGARDASPGGRPPGPPRTRANGSFVHLHVHTEY